MDFHVGQMLTVYEKDYAEAEKLISGSVSFLHKAVAESVAFERERCATVAEKLGHKAVAIEIRKALNPWANSHQ